MSIPGVGKLFSVHISLLKIAGYVIPIPKYIIYPSDETVRSAKKEGLSVLMNCTGSDFGMDVLGWHKYLYESKKYRYEFYEPYEQTVNMLKIKGYDVNTRCSSFFSLTS